MPRPATRLALPLQCNARSAGRGNSSGAPCPPARPLRRTPERSMLKLENCFSTGAIVRCNRQAPKRIRLLVDFLVDRFSRRTMENHTGCFAGRTTRLTPTAVISVPAMVLAVMGSPNSSQAIRAVQGGTRYIRLVTDAAAPRWISK